MYKRQVVILVLASLAGFVMVKPFQRITRSISAVTEGYDDNYLHENAYTETQLDVYKRQGWCRKKTA